MEGDMRGVNYTPPRWATRFLRWYCRPELAEDLEGDLHEFFQRNLALKGPRQARWIYILDVLKFLRLYTVRQPSFFYFLTHWIMLRSYLTTSGRNMVRHKLFSFINIAGLAVSMSVGLVVIGVLSDVLSYDTFHVHRDRTYRLISRYEYMGDKGNSFMGTTSLRAARLIHESFSGVEEMVAVRGQFQGDWQLGEKIVPLSGFWTQPSFFNVFSFELIKGNAATALQRPFSVVLTETSARKLFGDEDPIGKTMVFNKDRSYTVTGVVKDIPFFSHIKFEMLGSLSTLEIVAAEEWRKDAWDDVWNTWVYLRLPPKTDLADFDARLAQLSAQEDPSVPDTHIELDLQPMKEIMFSDSMGNQIGPVMGGTLLWVFGGLAFVVILSAGLNYTNLSIARALRRTREVGVRKAIGAMRGHVMAQFLVEAVLISLCALSLAVVCFILVRPHFLTIEPDIQKMFTLQLSPAVLVMFFVFAVVVGLLAGLFPSLFFANVRALQVLKGSSFHGSKKVTGRKVLMVVQYCISIILVCVSIGVYRQYIHYINYDLGFSTENILNLSLQGNSANVLKKELAELPEVKGMAQSMIVTSVGNYWGTNMRYPGNPLDTIGTGVSYNTIDEHYMPLHGHQLIAGRNFLPKPDSARETEVIVNQQVLKRFNIGGQDPEKALGDVLRVDQKDMTIVGVMKDFSYGRANDRSSRETIFRHDPKQARWLNVKIQSDDLIATYAKIEAIWKRIDPNHPLEARFYSDQIAESFSGLKATVKLAGFLAFLAICIASLGLLGMVVFTTEVRLKEISIRKVMGASETTLLFLLGRGFILLLLLAAGISVPLVVLGFEQVVFPNIANHAPINLGEMLWGVVGVLVVAVLTIVTQSLKTARANPAEVLKNE